MDLPPSPEVPERETELSGIPYKGIVFLLAGLLIGAILAYTVLISGGVAGRETSSEPVDIDGPRLPAAVGSAAPDFTLPNLEGESVSLSSLRGKPVVINFWATWCAPCKEEMPLLEKTAQQLGDQVVILGVDYAEGKDVVQSFVSELGLTFPILLDSDGAVADRYFVRNYPSTFFVDAEGVVRAQRVGLLDEDLLEKYLETIGIEP